MGKHYNFSSKYSIVLHINNRVALDAVNDTSVEAVGGLRVTIKAKAAVEVAGRSVKKVYYNKLGFRALLKPEWFEKKGKLLPKAELEEILWSNFVAPEEVCGCGRRH
ncbi:Uncharacterized protein Fot_34619 [Forsythia ovata]|uniref:Uncharacterized protein n=1 Tax=Forsythia ovata TaxID=205694 RepID=A0ABD1SJB4_9LAMI